MSCVYDFVNRCVCRVYDFIDRCVRHVCMTLLTGVNVMCV